MTRKAHRHDLSVWFDGSEIAERDDALTMRSVTHNGHEKLTLLELVLQLGEINGDILLSMRHRTVACADLQVGSRLSPLFVPFNGPSKLARCFSGTGAD